MTDIATPFMNKIRNAEILDADTEFALATAWRKNGDQKARAKLVEAYLKLAHKEARKAAKFDMPVEDMIQEASLGLLKAVDKFDPERGFRFSTYAQYWIRAMLQDYRMRNQGMVRVGTTADQKSLFFNLARVRKQIEHEASLRGETLSTSEVHQEISERLNASIEDVQRVDAYLRKDTSLSAPIATDGDETGATRQDMLVDEGPQAEHKVEAEDVKSYTQKILAEAMAKLTPRERHIVISRKMSDQPRTLEDLGLEYNVSRERIRQLEVIGLKKIKAGLSANRNVRDLIAA